MGVAGFGPHGHRASRVAVVPSAVLGMLILVSAEIMFFAGVISAYLIARAGAIAWPPPDQPRLPVEVTAVNTVVLLASGALLFLAARAFGAAAARRQVTRRLIAAAALGAAFVGIQGFEWVRLIGYGLTLTSSTYGSFFYLIVGAHALHAVGGLVTLGWAAGRLRAGTLTADSLRAVEILWYLVVALWPLLYVLVYLL